MIIPIRKWSDDQAWCVTEVLVRVTELSVTDVSEAVLLLLVPPVTQLYPRSDYGQTGQQAPGGLTGREHVDVRFLQTSLVHSNSPH